jgi:hypothetical protein
MGGDLVGVPEDEGTVLFGTWRVGAPARQEAAVEAIASAWRARAWPGGGLRSYAVLTGEDGSSVLHVSQLAEGGGGPPDTGWKREVDAAVPGIERDGVVASRLRTSTPAYGAAGDAGCVVLVTRVFDGPDLDRAYGLVQAMFDGGAAVPPAEGMISAHFLVSLDGARVFNYALWASVDAHREAVGSRPSELDEDPDWQRAHTWPGLLSTTFQRFRPRLHLTGG